MKALVACLIAANANVYASGAGGMDLTGDDRHNPTGAGAGAGGGGASAGAVDEDVDALTYFGLDVRPETLTNERLTRLESLAKTLIPQTSNQRTQQSLRASLLNFGTTQPLYIDSFDAAIERLMPGIQCSKASLILSFSSFATKHPTEIERFTDAALRLTTDLDSKIGAIVCFAKFAEDHPDSMEVFTSSSLSLTQTMDDRNKTTIIEDLVSFGLQFPDLIASLAHNISIFTSAMENNDKTQVIATLLHTPYLDFCAPIPYTSWTLETLTDVLKAAMPSLTIDSSSLQSFVEAMLPSFPAAFSGEGVAFAE